jgi:pSer/pThr/pTyr-binding forkhead associated (FHA) protein
VVPICADVSIATGPSIALATASLTALTEEAHAALGSSEVQLTDFPFRVGREKRAASWRWPGRIDRRVGDTPGTNDLYLIEHREHPFISRDHFLIERAQDRFILVDRGSLCGTVVTGTRVGGYRSGGRTELRHGDVIIIGTSKSPYAYRFDVGSEPERDEPTRK